MVDLHTHILSNIDDGASSVEEAFLLAEELFNQGVRSVVCTPHFDPRKNSIMNFVEKRTEAISKMDGSPVSLITGSETILNDYLFHYPELSQLCIYNTNYILIELPYSKKWQENVFEMLEKLINYYGLTPIIAHIERYPAIKKKKKHMRRLVDLGCLLQLNASSVINRKSWRKVSRYLMQGFIDVLASDCHNMNNRPPLLSDAYRKINLVLGNKYSKLLMENAERIISGIELKKKQFYMIE